ncbi:MAG TPA: hypothetical protein VNA04_09590 [Thermoanaerobaculia bacterium]|nr:hypothetical protein [Thermoanaerobaculia bacterium]
MIAPYPFTRVIYLYGDPIEVPRNGDLKEWRGRVEGALNALAELAESDFEGLWKEGAVNR